MSGRGGGRQRTITSYFPRSGMMRRRGGVVPIPRSRQLTMSEVVARRAAMARRRLRHERLNAGPTQSQYGRSTPLYLQSTQRSTSPGYIDRLMVEWGEALARERAAARAARLIDEASTMSMRSAVGSRSSGRTVLALASPGGDYDADTPPLPPPIYVPATGRSSSARSSQSAVLDAEIAAAELVFSGGLPAGNSLNLSASVAAAEAAAAEAAFIYDEMPLYQKVDVEVKSYWTRWVQNLMAEFTPHGYAPNIPMFRIRVFRMMKEFTPPFLYRHDRLRFGNRERAVWWRHYGKSVWWRIFHLVKSVYSTFDDDRYRRAIDKIESDLKCVMRGSCTLSQKCLI